MGQRDPSKPFPHDSLWMPLIWVTPAWVTPNHVTILRMLLTPIVLFLLWTENYAFGVPLFLFTALTDAFDGSLARIRNKVTPWGVFYDPVADKVLVGSVLLLILLRYINPYLAAGLILVEVLLILFGWYKRRRGTVGTANVWGKVKMVLEVIGIMMLLIAVWSGMDLFIHISTGTLTLALVFAIVSLLTYSL